MKRKWASVLEKEISLKRMKRVSRHDRKMQSNSNETNNKQRVTDFCCFCLPLEAFSWQKHTSLLIVVHAACISWKWTEGPLGKQSHRFSCGRTLFAWRGWFSKRYSLTSSHFQSRKRPRLLDHQRYTQRNCKCFNSSLKVSTVSSLKQSAIQGEESKESESVILQLLLLTHNDVHMHYHDGEWEATLLTRWTFCWLRSVGETFGSFEEGVWWCFPSCTQWQAFSFPSINLSFLLDMRVQRDIPSLIHTWGNTKKTRDTSKNNNSSLINDSNHKEESLIAMQSRVFSLLLPLSFCWMSFAVRSRFASSLFLL